MNSSKNNLILFLVSGVVCVILSVKLFYNYFCFKSYPVCASVVKSVSKKKRSLGGHNDVYYIELKCDYSVNGLYYESAIYTPDIGVLDLSRMISRRFTLEEASEIEKKHYPGENVTLFYNPIDPSQSFAVLPNVGFCCFSLIVGLLISLVSSFLLSKKSD